MISRYLRDGEEWAYPIGVKNEKEDSGGDMSGVVL